MRALKIKSFSNTKLESLSKKTGIHAYTFECVNAYTYECVTAYISELNISINPE
jgi:hypothetical protein